VRHRRLPLISHLFPECFAAHGPANWPTARARSAGFLGCEGGAGYGTCVTEDTASRRLRVAVIFGGRSAEHEISLLSARFVLESLDPERYEPVLIGIDKSGRWLLQEQALLLQGARDPRLVALDVKQPSVVLPPHPGSELVRTGGAATASTALDGVTASAAGMGIDVAFPVLHGPMGEDGTVQGLLELAGVPYVGSGVLGSAVGMDKDVMKRLLGAAGLPIVPWVTLRRPRFASDRASVLEQCMALGLPLFVKPANLGSSVGVTRVKEAARLADAIEYAFEFDDKVVVEAGLASPREIECAVLGGEPPFASVPGEIVVDHADGFYSYRAKYIDESGAVTRIPADLTDTESAEAQRLALATFAVLEGEGLARVDLFFDAERRFWVNEINTLPGFTAISMFPKLMQASGVAPRELVTRLIEDARTRAEQRKKRRTLA
jgi:D-alanine-D-alanine ligase